MATAPAAVFVGCPGDEGVVGAGGVDEVVVGVVVVVRVVVVVVVVVVGVVVVVFVVVVVGGGGGGGGAVVVVVGVGDPLSLTVPKSCAQKTPFAALGAAPMPVETYDGFSMFALWPG
jgi:hypothetical protein